MSEERDPRLESLFADARRELVDEEFVARVMTGMEARGRRIMIVRAAIAVLLISLEVLLDSPLQNSVGTVADLLGATLVAIDHEWISFALAPVNSIAGILGLILLGLHYLFRRLEN